jgi:hypothetical protein
MISLTPEVRSQLEQHLAGKAADLQITKPELSKPLLCSEVVKLEEMDGEEAQAIRDYFKYTKWVSAWIYKHPDDPKATFFMLHHEHNESTEENLKFAKMTLQRLYPESKKAISCTPKVLSPK